MNALQLRVISSPDELRESADAWDDLWQRSNVATPTARASIVALRVEFLEAASSFRALVVEQRGRMLAALPIVGRRLRGPLHVGTLPCNHWLAGANLLLDATDGCAAVMDCLVRGVSELPWSLLWLDHVAFEEPHWSAFLDAARRANLRNNCREHYRVGRIPIEQNWDTYRSQLKGEHRRKLARLARKLDETGGAELRIHREMAPDQVTELLRIGFEVEDRSWKGAEGTSVLKNPKIWEYFQREAQIMAQLGLLELVLLEHIGRPIAFAYAWHAKGIHFIPKIGYDEAFAKFAPGQQMLIRMLETYHSDPVHRAVDFSGPYAEFHKMWTRNAYPVGRLVVASQRLMSRSLFHAYTHWQPRVRRLRERVHASIQTVRDSLLAAFGRLDDPTAGSNP